MNEVSIHQSVPLVQPDSKRGQGTCAALLAVACAVVTLWLTASSGSDYIGTFGAGCGTARSATLSTLWFAPFPLGIGLGGWLASKAAHFGSAVARCALISAAIGWLATFIFALTFQHFIN